MSETVLQDRFLRTLSKTKDPAIYDTIKKFIAGKSRIRKNFEDLLYLSIPQIKSFLNVYLSQGVDKPLESLESFINKYGLSNEIKKKKLLNLSAFEQEDIRFIHELADIIKEEEETGEKGKSLTFLEDYVNKNPRNRRNFLILTLIGGSKYILDYVSQYDYNVDKINERINSGEEDVDTAALSPQVFLINYISRPDIRSKLQRTKKRVKKLYSKEDALDEPTGEMKKFLIDAGIFPMPEKRKTEIIGRKEDLKQRPQAPLDINPDYVEFPPEKYSDPSNILSLKVEADESVKDIAREIGLSLLKDSIPSKDEQYISDIEQSIYDSSDTYNDYFEKITRITIPLTYTGIKEYASLFQKRISKKLYTPEALSEITTSDIFGEIFENPNISVEDQERVLEQIRNLREKMMNFHAYSVISTLYPERRINIRIPSEPINIGLENIPLKSYCSDNIDASEDNFILYKEGDEIYCFTILELINRFKNDDYKNPSTGNDFTEEFISKVKGFDPKRVSDAYFEEIFGPEDFEEEKVEVKEIKEEEELAPGLVNIILDELDKLESEFVEEAPKEKVCEYCKKNLSEESILNSVIYENRKPKIVSFCSTDCFGKIEF